MATTSQKQLEILTGKVLSRTQARGGFSTALIYEPDDKMEAEHGRLLFVIDISSPSPLSADIAYNLIDIIKEEYYSDLELPASESFENALKAANEELAAIAKQGEKDWVGKFNAIIAAVHGKSLYVVQRGTAEIHLLRGMNMLNLSKGIYTPGETYKPEETLVNLIEGQVQVGDKIIASTSELFYYISIEKLRRLIDSNNPGMAAKKLADQLGSENEINRTSVLISEFTLPELMEDPETVKNSENWVGAAEATPKKPAVQIPAEPVISLDKEQSIEEITHSYKVAEDVPVTTHEETNQEEGQTLSESAASIANSLTNMIPKWSNDGLNNLKNNIRLADYASKLNVDSPKYKEVLSTAWRIVRGVARLIWSMVLGATAYVVSFVKATKRRKNGDKILLAVFAGVAILIVVSSIGISRGYTQRVGLSKANAALIDAKQKRDEAQAAIIYENGAKARDLLAAAYASAMTASSNSKTREEASALAAALLEELDTTSGVTRFESVQPLANFDALATQLGGTSESPKAVKLTQAAFRAGDIYAIDGDNNKIYKFKTLTGEYSIANSLTSTNANLALVSPAANETDLFIYADPNSLYSFNTQQNTLTGRALDAGNWVNADKILAYTNKLYMMVEENNQIYKYQEIPEGYTSVAPYFESNAEIDIEGALDFAIDGNVWVLMSDNTIKQYQTGIESPFSLREVPNPYPAIGKIVAFYTDANTDLFVLDETNKRVISFNKEGDYLGQWVYDDIDNPTGLTVDAAGGFIYVTAGTSVYRLPLK